MIWSLELITALVIKSLQRCNYEDTNIKRTAPRIERSLDSTLDTRLPDGSVRLFVCQGE
jgi:hypothetical protein